MSLRTPVLHLPASVTVDDSTGPPKAQLPSRYGGVGPGTHWPFNRWSLIHSQAPIKHLPATSQALPQVLETSRTRERLVS